MKLVTLPDDFVIPPELLRDEDLPSADPFNLKLDRMRKLVAGQRAQLRRLQVDAVHLHMEGLSNVAIAKRLGVTPPAISRNLNLPLVKAHIRAVEYLNSLIDGPTTEIRKNMLWRIARRNEHDEPNIAISRPSG